MYFAQNVIIKIVTQSYRPSPTADRGSASTMLWSEEAALP